ncbi:DUF6636 domain-containing protein [Mycobacterium sp. B14F4]|uniref:DUF6636 domain-containing protein n=1 Tax=Mycobacterium sp. B14F4 TaxID=3153565 RepID=UPI00325EC328
MARLPRRRAALSAGLAATIALGGCVTPPEATPAQSPASSGAPQTSAPAEQESDELLGFIAPSGNVACMLDTGYVRCDIMDRDWSPPPRPADCGFDYGQGVSISESGPAEFVCAGDTTFGSDQVLPYGESMSAGAMRCESAEPGVTCRNSQTGRGFFLSRQSYRLF